MGVPGLNTFMNSHPSFTNTYKLCDTSVIIDGYNLVYTIYTADYVHGGDYDRFSTDVRRYFSNLLKCNIRPVVIFDGAYDIAYGRLDIAIKNTEERIKSISRIANSWSPVIPPILTNNLFKDILMDMNIKHVQCDHEADREIASLANSLKCPVISMDNDFHIFNLKYGFIRTDSISKWVSRDRYGKYLSCKFYTIDNFLSFFPGVDKALMPLLAILMGNDLFNAETLAFFLHELPEFKQSDENKKDLSWKTKDMIIGILKWLKHRKVPEAIEEILKSLKLHEPDTEKIDEMRKRIYHAIKAYHIEPSDLYEFVKSYEYDTVKLSRVSNTNLFSYCKKSLPIWFIRKLRSTEFPAFFLNIVEMRKVVLHNQIEDTSLESANVCSKYIRMVMYGILLTIDITQDSKDHEDWHIEEYDRHDNSLAKERVKPIFQINGTDHVPKFDHLNHLDSSFAVHFIAAVAGDRSEYYANSVPELKLFIICVRYWLKNSSQAPLTESFYSLLLTVLYLNIGLFTKNLIHGAEAHTSGFKNNMEEYTKKFRHTGLNIRIVHSFSQLQSCFLYMSFLNKLLDYPFASIKADRIFCGTMLHNLTKMILRSSPEACIFELGLGSNLEKCFKRLENTILYNIPEHCLQKPVYPSAQVNMKPGEMSATKNENESTLNNRFECLKIGKNKSMEE